jgi:hypothetical protein
LQFEASLGKEFERPYLKKKKKKSHHQKRAGAVAQGVGSEFKLQYHKKISEQLKK